MDTGILDTDIYGGKGKFEGYVTSIASKEDEEDDEENTAPKESGRKLPSYTAPTEVLKDMEKGQEDDFDPFAEHRLVFCYQGLKEKPKCSVTS